VGSSPLLPRPGTVIDVDGGIGALLASSLPQSTMLWLLDFSDPTAPRVRATLSPALATDVAVAGDAVLVATPSALLVFDAAGRSYPALSADGLVDGGPPWRSTISDVAAANGRAFVLVGQTDDRASPPAVRTAFLVVLDLSQPTQPRRVASLQLPPSAEHDSMLVTDGRLAASYSYRDSGIRLVDVSRPDQPRPVGEVPPTTDKIVDAAIADHVLVTVSRSQLAATDVTDPSRPLPKGTVPLQAGTRGSVQPTRVVMSATAAYVASVGEGLQIVDTSTDRPAEVGRLGAFDKADRIATDGEHLSLRAEVMGYNRSWRILDLATPLRPEPQLVLQGDWAGVGTFHIHDVAHAGRHAYAGGDPMRIVDLREPPTAEKVAAHALEGGMYATDSLLAVAPPRAFILHIARGGEADTGRLIRYDVTTPLQPRLLDMTIFPDLSQAVGLFAHGPQLFVLTRDGNLHVIDVAQPARPRLAARIALGAAAGGTNQIERPGGPLMVLAGPYLIVGSNRGLHVVDIAEPAQPTVIRRLDRPAPVVALATADGYLYAALARTAIELQTQPAELLVLDLADPGDPSVLSHATIPGDPTAVAAHGPLVYAAVSGTAAIADGDTGLLVVQAREAPKR
jgi:hypothetical protein